MSQRVKIIEPIGVLDGNRGGQLRQTISEIITAGGQVILLDLQQVSFMDSSGLGSLVASLKVARNAGVELCLCSVAEQVKMLFELTHMDQVFTIFSDRKEFEANFGTLDMR
jgi:anti-anti-sigma factor